MLTAGSFVNHSHLAQFVNLAVGAGLSLLLYRVGRDIGNKHSSSRWNAAGGGLALQTARRQAMILVPVGICFIAIFLCLSRNGVVSLLIASTVTGFFVVRRKNLRPVGWLLLAASLVALAVMLVLGFDVVYHRFETLEGTQDYVDRWRLMWASLKGGLNFWLTGAGLGSFSYVFPKYDTTDSTAVAVYADNEYAQMFLEGGVIGISLLALFLCCVCRSIKKGMQVEGGVANVSFGILYAFIAVAIHSTTDFGQRIPAIGLLSATLCGVLVALPKVSGSSTKTGSRYRIGMALGGMVVTIPLFAWILLGAHKVYQAESWLAVANLAERDLVEGKGTDDFERLLDAATNAVDVRPNDAEARYWLNFYRWWSITAVGKEFDPEQRTVVEELTGDLAAIRELYPTYHPAYVLEAELRGYQLKQVDAAERLLAKAVDYALNDATANFAYGLWLIRRGQAAVAEPYLARAVKGNPRLFEDTCVALLDSDASSIAKNLAGTDFNRLVKLGELFAERRIDSHDIDLEIEQMLQRSALDGTLSAGQTAELARRKATKDEHAKAVELYYQALSQNYGNVHWRYQLAISLKELGRYSEAMRHARICRQKRKDVGIQEFLEELVLLEARATALGQSE